MAIGLATVAAFPAVAQANAASDYPPNSNARTFAHGLGGWTSSAQQGGVCIPAINCPVVTNSHRASGGLDGNGDGFIRTSLGSLAGAAAVSQGTWTSPSFTYNGADGKVADRLVVTLRRRAAVGEFLSVAGNSADFTMQVLQGDSGDSIVAVVVDQQPIDDLAGWVAINPVELNAKALSLGGTYRIRIITRFTNSAKVVPAAQVDYDNVDMRAVDEPTAREVRHQIITVLPAHATLTGNRIFVRMRCPASVSKRCRYALVGLVRRGGPRLTLPRYARVAPGRVKTLGLSVRQGFQRSVADRKRVLVRIRGRVGSTTITVFRRMKLVQR